MEKKVLIKIPTSERPMFKVDVNGVDYEHPAGIETEVPESVASVIQNIYDLTPKPLPPQPSGGKPTDTRMKDFIEGTLTELYDDQATSVGDFAFYMTNILKINLPNVTEMGENAFQYSSIEDVTLPSLEGAEGYVFANCEKLESLYLPMAKYVPDYCARNCTALKSASFPLAKYSVNGSCFFGCTALKELDLPLLESTGNNFVQGCSALEYICLPKIKSIGLSCFRNCYSLKAIILRNTETIANLESTNAFNDCYHFQGTVNATYNPDGLKDGYIYVPRALLSDDDATMDYRRATNWTTFADQFRAIEDYTVDGTLDGEMDWEKMGVTV